MSRTSLLLAGCLLLASCVASRDERARRAIADSTRVDSIARARQDSINRASPGYVIDSILPAEEELRRFRTELHGHTVTRLANASTSRDALVRRFMMALARSDTGELKRMALQPREFADLVYPQSPYTHPPYHQSPALVWYQIENGSSTGFTRLLRRVAGQPLTYLDHRCDPKPDRQGQNEIWTNCILRIVGPAGDTSSHRLFGSIIQRDGLFKIVSYRNEF
ncbi:MAG TPA: hypothetical protein VGN73_05700 [Gemmatimonadaceae bacterium]|nr:hypothetical protein [Gemmatimonadaceae bacterium]